MTTYAFPTLSRVPNTCDWGQESNTQVFTSPLTKAVQTIERVGARWSVTLQYNSLAEADCALIQSFLAKLRGQANRFTMWNFARPVPRGTAGGSPTVNNESGSPTTLQTGNTLITKAWTAGATLKEGDFFGVNGELKMVTAAVTADGSGNMTITFEPPLRSSPAHGAALTVTRPTTTFMLTEPRYGGQTVPGKFTNFTLQAIEQF